MTDNYTPSTEEVRLAYAQNYVKTVEYHENGFAEFDRWYTAESARLRAEGAAEARAQLDEALAELDKIEDSQHHDIDGMIATVPWAEDIVRRSYRLRRILARQSFTPVPEEERTNG